MIWGCDSHIWSFSSLLCVELRVINTLQRMEFTLPPAYTFAAMEFLPTSKFILSTTVLVVLLNTSIYAAPLTKQYSSRSIPLTGPPPAPPAPQIPASIHSASSSSTSLSSQHGSIFSPPLHTPPATTSI